MAYRLLAKGPHARRKTRDKVTKRAYPGQEGWVRSWVDARRCGEGTPCPMRGKRTLAHEFEHQRPDGRLIPAVGIRRRYPLRSMASRFLYLALLGVLVLSAGGCFPKRYNAAKATRHYPAELGQGETINVQVTRSGSHIVIVNGTAIEFEDIDLWMNQRYLHHLSELRPGGTVRISLGDFWDVWGGGPNPGGLLRWYDPTPVVLVQAQIDQESPLIGFISILDSEELER